MQGAGGSHLIYEYEDDYISLAIKDMLFNNWRYLLFEESVQGALNLNRLEIPPLEYVRMMFEVGRAWPTQARSGLIGGMGSAALWHAARAEFGPKYRLITIEVEQMIHDLAKRYFMVPAKADVRVQDIREALESEAFREFDRIWIDCYNAVMVPTHLMTVEFFERVAAALSEDGVAIFNIWREDANPIWGHQCRTLLQVFPYLGTLICRHDANMVLIASRMPLEHWPALIKRDETLYSVRICSQEQPRDWPPAIANGEIFYDESLSEQLERIGFVI